MDDDERYRVLKEIMPLMGSGEITLDQLIVHFLKEDKDRSKASSVFAPLYMEDATWGLFLAVTANGSQRQLNPQTKVVLTENATKFINAYEQKLQVKEEEKQEKEAGKQDREHQKKHRELSMRIMETQVSDYDSQKKTTLISKITAIVSVVIAFLSWAWNIYDTHTKTYKIDSLTDKINSLTKENYVLRDSLLFYYAKEAKEKSTSNPKSPRKDTLHQ